MATGKNLKKQRKRRDSTPVTCQEDAKCLEARVWTFGKRSARRVVGTINDALQLKRRSVRKKPVTLIGVDE